MLQFLSVTDDGSPIITGCPPDQTVQEGTVVTWTEPTATGVEPITRTSTYQSGATFNLGTSLVTYNFVDANGAESMCFFKVKVTGKYHGTLYGLRFPGHRLSI